MEYKKIQSATFFFLLIGVTLIFCWLLRPYVYPIFWAVVLAMIFHPLFKTMLPGLKNKKNLTAAVTLIITVLIVLIPLAAVASLVVKQAFDIYNQFGNEETLQKIN